MNDKPENPVRDYRETLFLPKTGFPMKAGLPQKEPDILKRWQAMDLFARLRVRPMPMAISISARHSTRS